MRVLQIIAIVCSVSCCHGIGRWDVFSTKTAYRWSHTVTATVDGSYSFTSGLETCKAVHVSMLTRHGARWPSDGDMEDTQKLYDKLMAANVNYPGLESWSPRYNLSDESELVPEGEKEQQEIAARVGTRFKSLFEKYGNHVKFVSSSSKRTQDSSEHFHKGLYSVIQSLASYSTEVNDTLIRPYDECETYEDTVESDDNLKEYIDFTESQRFLNIGQAIKSRLGVSFNLSDDDVEIIYELCAFERYIFNNITFWCDLITDAERLVLEYGSDLEDYYEASYGHQMNSKLTCNLVGDMFHTMDRAINYSWDYDNLGSAADNGYLAGKFYNGHSDTLIPLMTSLGLFEDSQPLLSTNMAEMTNRKFKTSTISPSSGNLAFVLYACDDSATSNRTFKLKLFVNEQPITMPTCGSDTCTYDAVRQSYVDLIENCRLQEMCKEDCKEEDETCSSCTMESSLFILALGCIVQLYLKVDL